MEQGSQRSLIEPMIDRTKPPHKFHVVTKVRSTYGETSFTKEALEKLGFISYGRRVNSSFFLQIICLICFVLLAMGRINSDCQKCTLDQ